MEPVPSPLRTQIKRPRRLQASTPWQAMDFVVESEESEPVQALPHSSDLFLSQYESNLASCLYPPYLFFRNPGGYVYDHVAHLRSAMGILTQKTSRKVVSRMSVERSKFFCDYASDFPIPVELLSETLTGEWIHEASDAHLEQLSTALAIRHGQADLVLFRSGRDFDEITLRNAAFASPRPPKRQPGFTAQVGKGSPIRHLASAGQSNFGLSANVLAGTRAELVFLQSLDGAAVGGEKSEHSFLLEEVQRYQLPVGLRHLAGSLTTSPNALALGEDGSLHRWSAGVGLSAVRTGLDDVHPFSVACAKHPQTGYLSSTQGLHLVDFRSPTPTLLFGEEVWAAVEGASSGLLVCSGPGGEVLVDSRRPGQSLHRRLGEGDRLLVAPFRQDQRGEELFAGTSTWAGQLRLHRYARHGPASIPSPLTLCGPLPSGQRGQWTRSAQGWVGGAEACTGLAIVPDFVTRCVTAFAQTAKGDILVYPLSLPGAGERSGEGEGDGEGDGEGQSVPELQSSAALGVRLLIGRTGRMGEPPVMTRKQERDHVGLLVRGQFDRRGAEPTTSPYLPTLSEEMMRRFDLLALLPRDLRVDRPTLPRDPMFVPEPVPSVCTEQQLLTLLDRFRGELEAHGRGTSLHEAVVFFQRHCAGPAVATAETVRRVLCSAGSRRFGLEELRLPRRECLAEEMARSANSDGLLVDSAGSDDDEGPGDQACLCHDVNMAAGGCGLRDCWVPHCLVYSVPVESASDDPTFSQAANSQLSQVDQQLRGLLLMQWEETMP